MNENVSRFLNKKNVEMMAVIGLSIVLALVLKNRLVGRKPVITSSSPVTTSEILPYSPSHRAHADDAEPHGRSVILKTDMSMSPFPTSPPSLMRDLFSPLNANYDPWNFSKEGGAHALVLKATFPDSERPLAIFNDEVVGIGDTVQGYRVIEIRKDEVILLSGQKERAFTLNEEESK